MSPPMTRPHDPLPDAAIEPLIYAALLEAMGDEMASLIADFVKTTGDLIDGIAAAEAAGDRERIKLNAHSIKSSAAVMGAMPLSAMAEDAESRAGASQTPVPECSATLRAAFSRAAAELAALGAPGAHASRA